MNNQETEVILTTEETTVNVNTSEVGAQIESQGQISVDTIPSYNVTGLSEKDINFYDYDGTLLYAYNASDFLLFNSLPAGPQKTGLVFKGWNWSFENLRKHILKVQKADVVAIYDTIDSATKIYIELKDRLKPSLNFAINGTAIIDWGDGTSTEVTGTIAGDYPDEYTEMVYTTHQYDLSGKYCISIQNGNNTLYFIEGQGSYSIITSEISYDENTGYTYGPGYEYYTGSVTEINIGSNVCLLDGACRNLSNLNKISLSDTCSTFDLEHVDENWYIVFENTNLTFIGFPKSFKLIGGLTETIKKISISDEVIKILNWAFTSCPLLERVIIPTSNDTPVIVGQSIFSSQNHIKEFIYDYDNINLTVIPQEMFSYCKLSKIIVGRYVETIASGAFNSCYASEIEIKGSLKRLDYAAFGGCYCLTSIKFNNTDELVIDEYALSSMSAMLYFDFSEVECVPQITNNTFNNIQNDSLIIVPDNYYNAYLADTNWSALASHIIKKSDFDNR